MTSKEFEKLALTIKAAYPNSQVMADVYAMKVWYRMLGDLDYKIAENAIAEHISMSPFPPSISDIRTKYAERLNKIPDWGEAWGKVNKAIQRYGSYREAEAMESLDDITREAVKRIGFRDLCTADQENLETNRAQFRDIYKAVAKRWAEEKQLSPLVLENREKMRKENIAEPKLGETLRIDCAAEIEQAMSQKADPGYVEKLLKEFKDSLK